ncbi:MAG: transposase family protein [Dermatophilaceae bacterium]
MPSSPTVEPSRTDLQLRRADGLMQVLAQLPDPRRRRAVRHRVAGIVAVALTAVLAGARSYAAIRLMGGGPERSAARAGRASSAGGPGRFDVPAGAGAPGRGGLGRGDRRVRVDPGPPP